MGLLGQAINYRSDGEKHPHYRRGDWIFMAGALMHFGPSALAEGGDFLDFAWAEAPDVDSANSYNVERQRKCRRRAPKLAKAFSSVCASGEVVSGYAPIGGGAVTNMPQDWWLTDDPLLRYRTFSIDPTDPFLQASFAAVLDLDRRAFAEESRRSSVP